MSSDFYILSPVDYLDVTRSDDVLGKIIKDYTRPFEDYLPLDNQSTHFTQFSTHVSDLDIKFASKDSIKLGISIGMGSLGLDVANFGISSERGREFRFSGEKITYMRLVQQSEAFESLMLSVPVRSKVLEWTKHTFKKRSPVCMVVGLLTCDSRSIRFVEEEVTKLGSGIGGIISKSRPNVGTIASIAPSNLQIEHADGSLGNEGNKRTIFALQLRVVQRSSLFGKLVLTNKRISRRDADTRPTTKIRLGDQTTAANVSSESDTMLPAPPSRSISSGSEIFDKESQSMKTHDLKVDANEADLNLLGNPWDYIEDRTADVENIRFDQSLSELDIASQARSEPIDQLLDPLPESIFPGLQVSRVAHSQADHPSKTNVTAQQYIYLGNSINSGTFPTEKLPTSVPICENCQIERCYDIRVSSSLSTPRLMPLNIAKCAIETWLDTSIDWWPLKNATYPPSPDYSRISWRWTNAVSGSIYEMDVQHKEVPEQLALLKSRMAVVCLNQTHEAVTRTGESVKKMLSNSPEAFAAGSTIALSDLSSTAGTSAGSGTTGVERSQTSGVVSMREGRNTNTTRRRRPVSQAIPPKVESGCYLILTVNHGNMCHRFQEIKLHEASEGWGTINDESFCKALQLAYRTLRGWRYWFGLETIWKFKFVGVRSLQSVSLIVHTTDCI